MSQGKFVRFAGAVLALGWQMPLHAAMITYTYTGAVTDATCVTTTRPCTNDPFLSGSDQAFDATVVVDSTARSITSFSFTVGGSATWQGFGGRIDSGNDNLAFRLSGQNLPITYTSRPPLANGVLFIFSMLDLAGPASAFGGFIDGLATTFDLPSMTTHGGSNFYCATGTSSFNVRLDAVAGRLGVDEPSASLPEPGTTAMVGLAGLAALRARRRHKAGVA